LDLYYIAGKLVTFQIICLHYILLQICSMACVENLIALSRYLTVLTYKHKYVYIQSMLLITDFI